MMTAQTDLRPPFTHAVRQALRSANNSRAEADLLFFEAWEIHPSAHLGAALRASQIRRANPDLAAAIEAELRTIARRTRG